MPRFNTNLYPPEGYVFKDKDGVRHTGDDFRDLYRKIKEYRRLNRFSAGDPESEVNHQMCLNYPGYCREVGARRVVPVPCTTCGRPPRRRK